MPDFHGAVPAAKHPRHPVPQLAAHVERGPAEGLVHQQHGVVPGRRVGGGDGGTHGRGHDENFLAGLTAAAAGGQRGRRHRLARRYVACRCDARNALLLDRALLLLLAVVLRPWLLLQPLSHLAPGRTRKPAACKVAAGGGGGGLLMLGSPQKLHACNEDV